MIHDPNEEGVKTHHLLLLGWLLEDKSLNIPVEITPFFVLKVRKYEARVVKSLGLFT